MNLSPKKANRFRKWSVVLALLLVVVAVSGCQTFTFYKQAIKGQYQLFAQARPVKKLLADPEVPAQLKQRFELVRKLRAFAEQSLSLPVNGHYQKYVDVHRPFVVWNVEATPELSMQPKTWWYPLVGSLEYRGYFAKADADHYGDWLAGKGYDVYLGGAIAYSTLGWFKDPLLSTFIFEPDYDFAETLFHELGHQRLFARGDTDFNEAFATTVGQEGARRWLRSTGDTAGNEKYMAELQRTRQFVRLVMAARSRLENLYGDERTEEDKVKATEKKRNVPREKLLREKERILEELRQQYAELKKQWNGNTEYDRWFAKRLNNAKLNSVAAYYDFVPGFEHLLAMNGGDLEKFYSAAERLSKMPKTERHQWLRNLGQGSGTPKA